MEIYPFEPKPPVFCKNMFCYDNDRWRSAAALAWNLLTPHGCLVEETMKRGKQLTREVNPFFASLGTR
jgi:hypothetical protein